MKYRARDQIPLMLILLALAGCSTPPFAVTEADNRFTENKNQLFIGKNNRISSKSVAGGTHLDAMGVYIDPFVEMNSTDGQLVLLGFNIVNKTNYDTLMGDPNGLGTIEEVVFRFSDGELVSLPTVARQTRSEDTISYNSVGGYAEYDIWETASTTISIDEYNRIADSDSISVKITGSRQSVVYEEKDIAPTFISNLRSFRDSYIPR